MIPKAAFLNGLEKMEEALENIGTEIRHKAEKEARKQSIKQWYRLKKAEMKLDHLEKRTEAFRKTYRAESLRIDENKKTS
ncbi:MULTISPECIES: hypothetical protein [Heyndrickxia]|uniref:hypothetical protein n=1 Tax=Heyndrickxia TaxID=2837504 RepID=UPI00041EC233|nr:hypothetical protein [Heyndrickxia coagulans]